MKLPWCKWYPQDWLSEDGLQVCDPATRGIWIDAVNRMILKGTDFVTGTDLHLSKLLRCTITQLQAAVCELETLKIASVSMQNGCTILTCRRLARNLYDRKLKAKAANARWCKTDADHVKPDDARSASASAYASVSASSQEGGLGETHAERPSRKEVLAKAQMIGLAEWKAMDWFNEMQGCGWLDYQHRPVLDWVAVMTRVRVKWESDGRPATPPKPRGVNGSETVTRPMDIKAVIQAKEIKAAEIRSKHCSDTAIDQIWDNPDKRAEYFSIKREVKVLNNKLSNLA